MSGEIRRMKEEEINAFKNYLMIMSDEKYNVFKEQTGLDRENLISKIINSDYTGLAVSDQFQYNNFPRNVNFYEFQNIFPNAVVSLTFVFTQPIDVYFYIDKDFSEPSNTQPDGRSSKKKKTNKKKRKKTDGRSNKHNVIKKKSPKKKSRREKR